jgi:hypothetical protein
VELPEVGAAHRFGTTSIDQDVQSVEAETVFGLHARAHASTIRRTGAGMQQTNPAVLRADALTNFVANASAELPDDPSEQLTFLRRQTEDMDALRAEIDLTEPADIEFTIAGDQRTVSAVHTRGYTGLHTDSAGNIVIAVVPTDQLADASIGVITTL